MRALSRTKIKAFRQNVHVREYPDDIYVLKIQNYKDCRITKAEYDFLLELNSKSIKELCEDETLQSFLQTAKEQGICIELNDTESARKTVARQLIDFFIEFDFDISTRFINTLARQTTTSKMKEYVINYFKLSGNRECAAVINKLDSQEWSNIADTLHSIKSSDAINKRLIVYYGPQGTGKTTSAEKISDVTVVCHSGMLPQDLVEDFEFESGQPSFNKSAFVDAAETGKTILLDEFNLLPFETVRFLQGVLDNKDKFEYKSRHIKIHKDFKVIATMNLYVNGIEYPLTTPLVDRCAEIKSFEPDADLLAACI